jgi:hypothetical protein
MPSLTTNHKSIENQLATGGAKIRCPYCHGLNRDDGEYIRGNQPGAPLCCDRFTDAVFDILTQATEGQAKYPQRVRQASEMIEAKNLLYVDAQIRHMFAAARGTGREEISTGLADQILWCPYCMVDGKRVGNRFGNPELCCFDLGEAVAGVLSRMEIQRQMDNAARIGENADRLKECGVTVH